MRVLPAMSRRSPPGGSKRARHPCIVYEIIHSRLERIPAMQGGQGLGNFGP